MSETTSVSNTAFFEGVTTSDASARVQRVPVPIASPGACILCGKYEHPDGFVFFGLDFEFYGTLYFCADCVGDIATPFGWMHPERVNSLAAKHQQAVEENETLKTRLAILEQSVESLTRYSDLSHNPVNTSAFAVLEQVVLATDEQSEPSSDVSDESSTNEQPSNESDFSELISKQGTDDVPEPTSDESADGPKPTGTYLDIISELNL